MLYIGGILKSLIPRTIKDAVTLTILTPILCYVGYKFIVPTPPRVTIYSETTYPTEVIRGSYFYLNFDLSFDRACAITARRFIIGSDGTEYLALEDFKEVEPGVRMRYQVKIPVEASIPIGKALVRSDFEYECDWWSRHIRSTHVTGRERQITVLTQTSSAINSTELCMLPPEAGYTIVRTHYRKRR